MDFQYTVPVGNDGHLAPPNTWDVSETHKQGLGWPVDSHPGDSDGYQSVKIESFEGDVGLGTKQPDNIHVSTSTIEPESQRWSNWGAYAMSRDYVYEFQSELQDYIDENPTHYRPHDEL
jgi:hypothetical protein